MTINFSLLRPKDSDGKLKSDPVSILVTVCNLNSRVTVATGEKVSPKYWNVNRVKAAYIEAPEINKQLESIESEITKVWRDDKTVKGESLKSLVKDAVKGSGSQAFSQKKTLIEIVQQFIAQYSKEKDKSTITKYKALLSRLIDFSKTNPVSLETLDHNFYDSFKNFLYGQPNPNYPGLRLFRDGDHYVMQSGAGGLPVGIFDDVVFKYFTNLKVICAWAEKRGHNVHKAYKSWEILNRSYEPISLTLDELRKIEDLVITPAKVRHLISPKATNPEREAERKAKAMDVARDFLSLECRTGQRISDLKRFKATDINGNVWSFTQKKGNRMLAKAINLPLVGYCAPALLVLKKYNYELPKVTEHRVNLAIKEVCKLAGIAQPVCIYRWSGNKKIQIQDCKHEFISTHTGRKTFISIALQFMSPQTVMSITGIRSYKTLKHYDAGSEIGTIESALRSIEDGISIMRKHG
jgi:hypothetical protein